MHSTGRTDLAVTIDACGVDGAAHFLLWRQRWAKLETELGSTEVPLKRIGRNAR